MALRDQPGAETASGRNQKPGRAPGSPLDAAPWSDGRHAELEPYGSARFDHLGDVLHGAEARRLDCEPVKGEAVDGIGTFRVEPGKGDRNLVRERGLAVRFRS